MKKDIHSITISVFEKNQQNLDTIKNTISWFLPLEFEKEKITYIHEQIPGLQDSPTHIVRVNLSKKKHIELLLQNLLSKLSFEDRQLLYVQRESRLSNEGIFFIRLEKQPLIDHTFLLTDSGDCFHFKIKLAAYPATHSNFLQILEEILEKYDCIP